MRFEDAVVEVDANPRDAPEPAAENANCTLSADTPDGPEYCGAAKVSVGEAPIATTVSVAARAPVPLSERNVVPKASGTNSPVVGTARMQLLITVPLSDTVAAASGPAATAAAAAKTPIRFIMVNSRPIREGVYDGAGANTANRALGENP